MIKIMDYSKTRNEEIFYRGMAASGVEDIVAEIISDVRKNKDAALFKYCKKFDNTDTDKLEVTQEEINEAFASVDPHFIEVIKKARQNIYNYHIIDDLKMQEGAAGSAAPVYRITAIPALHCR